MTSAMLRARIPAKERAATFGTYPVSWIAASMLFAAPLETYPVLRTYRETVPRETPATRATSAIVTPRTGGRGRGAASVMRSPSSQRGRSPWRCIRSAFDSTGFWIQSASPGSGQECKESLAVRGRARRGGSRSTRRFAAPATPLQEAQLCRSRRYDAGRMRFTIWQVRLCGYATAWKVSLSPRASETLRTVDQVGLPRSERAL